MKRILFLIRTLNVGGAEHVLVDIANHLSATGYDVTVQTLIDEGGYRKSLSSSVHYQPGIKKNSILQRVFLHYLLLLPNNLIGNCLIRKGYTHIVAFTEGLPAKVVGGYSRSVLKKLAWVHTDLSQNAASISVFGSEDKNRKCYDQFDHIICVSNDAQKGYVKRLGEHRSILVQYNPLNKEKIIQKSLARSAYSFEDNDRVRLIAIGRLSHIKGFDLLIDAFAKAQGMVNKPIDLFIVGGGVEENSLKEQIASLNLDNSVFLCGQHENPYSIMSQCDIQIVPSRAEGYSLVLCEGHFLGLPVVATKCAGPIEILTSSHGGLLVDISVEALAEGIVQMVNDKELFATCKENVQRWSESYNTNTIYKQIEKLFE